MNCNILKVIISTAPPDVVMILMTQNMHNPSGEIVKVVEDFHHVCWTIGNMTLLPNAFFDNHTINTYCGCHQVWRGYEDRFY